MERRRAKALAHPRHAHWDTGRAWCLIPVCDPIKMSA